MFSCTPWCPCLVVRIAGCSSAKGCFALSDRFHFEKISFGINGCIWKDTFLLFCLPEKLTSLQVTWGTGWIILTWAWALILSKAALSLGKTRTKNSWLHCAPKALHKDIANPLFHLSMVTLEAVLWGVSLFFYLKLLL